MSVVVGVLGLLLSGFGIFLATNVASGTPFWSNAVVWVGLFLIFASQSVAIAMFFGKWLWTAPQLGMMSLSALLPCLYGFVFAPLFSFLLYSPAGVLAKCCLATPLLFFHVTWARRSERIFFSVVNDPNSNKSVWTLHPGVATIFSTSAAMKAAEKKGYSSTPPPIYIIFPLFLLVPVFIYRLELVNFFVMPFVPFVLLLMGSSVFLLFTSLVVFSAIMHFIVPARIVSQTDLPVLVNMMGSAGGVATVRTSHEGSTSAPPNERSNLD
jgi:hypothetical protein